MPMIMTGPRQYTDAALAAKNGLKEWHPPAGEPAWGTAAYATRAAARTRAKAPKPPPQPGRAVVSRAAPAARTAAQDYATLPPPPTSTVALAYMSPHELARQRGLVRRWLAMAKGGPLTAVDRGMVADAEARLHQLWQFGG